MSPNNFDNLPPNDVQFDQEIIDTPPEDDDTVKKAVPAWIISIVAHAVILGLLAVIVVASQVEIAPPPVHITVLPPTPPEEKPRPEHEIKPNDIKIDVEVEVEKPSPMSELEVPVEEFNREEVTDAEVPKGRDDAKADSEMGGPGALMAIGPGGGAAGMTGLRTGGGKKRALGKYGGNRPSEAAVDSALRWFKRHQSPNGQWDVDGYPANCTENPKCEPGTEHTGADGDIAGTGYAILCFLGAGFDHRMPSQYKPTVKAGIDWLLSVQKEDGLFGDRNYEHPIAVMALAEAYAMSNDAALKGPSQKGIDVLLSRQIKDKTTGYGLGWDYKTSNDRNDSSVTGWCVMALKSGVAAGLNVGNGMDGAKQWLEGAWKAANKDFKPSDPYTDQSHFPYTWNQNSGATDKEDRVPMGALCAVFLGHLGDDPMLNSMANFIMAKQLPKTYPMDTYYMYYNTLAIFQVAGDRWEKWNGTVRDILVNAQRTGDGCFDGSWDYEGTSFHGHKTGRILSTAYCCLSLEVYYRYRLMVEAQK